MTVLYIMVKAFLLKVDDSLSSSESEPFHQSKRVYRAPPAEEDRRRQKKSTRTDTDDVGNASEIVVELTGGDDADAQRASKGKVSGARSQMLAGVHFQHVGKSPVTLVYPHERGGDSERVELCLSFDATALVATACRRKQFIAKLAQIIRSASDVDAAARKVALNELIVSMQEVAENIVHDLVVPLADRENASLIDIQLHIDGEYGETTYLKKATHSMRRQQALEKVERAVHDLAAKSVVYDNKLLLAKITALAKGVVSTALSTATARTALTCVVASAVQTLCGVSGDVSIVDFAGSQVGANVAAMSNVDSAAAVGVAGADDGRVQHVVNHIVGAARVVRQPEQANDASPDYV